jgi:pyruvate dehydrogenase E1 component
MARDGQACERINRMNPDQPKLIPHAAKCLSDRKGPVIASTDYIRMMPEQIRPYINAPYIVLGTDGFGRSDTRENLRRFFEVDRFYIVVAALNGLADTGEVEVSVVQQAIQKYNLDTTRAAPWLV